MESQADTLTKTSSQTSHDAVRRLTVDLPCVKKSLARGRNKVVKFAGEHGFAGEAEDLALATQEALKNIIQHACPADNNMHIECRVTDDTIVVEVSDEGRCFDVSTLGEDHQEPLAPHGRGIRLMKGLMDEVSIVSDEEGTVVRMEKKRSADTP